MSRLAPPFLEVTLRACLRRLTPYSVRDVAENQTSIAPYRSLFSPRALGLGMRVTVPEPSTYRCLVWPSWRKYRKLGTQMRMREVRSRTKAQQLSSTEIIVVN